MNLTEKSRSAEIKLIQILEEFFVTVYDKKSLVSHGIEHHRRVWKYAKELVLKMAEHNKINDPDFPQKLIIACYLHDIGMSVDAGIRHGQHSKEICRRFFKTHKMEESDYKDVLLTIENHDNKDYQVSESTNDQLSILSAADDLDAFGLTGVYRYSEIYLLRGIQPEELGHLILDNAHKRFNNFEKTFSFSDELILKHKKRFGILEHFFIGYNKQIESYQFGSNKPSGYCGVVEMFYAILEKKIPLEGLLENPEDYSMDPIIIVFFKELAAEMFC